MDMGTKRYNLCLQHKRGEKISNWFKENVPTAVLFQQDLEGPHWESSDRHLRENIQSLQRESGRKAKHRNVFEECHGHL